MNTVKPVRAPIALVDQPESPANRPLVIATWIFNVLVPVFFALFAWKHAAAFVYTLRISNLIILTKVVLDFRYYVRRSTTPFVSTSAYAWLIAFCGTLAPLMFRPTDDVSDFWVATVLQIIGLAMQIYIIRTFKRGPEMAIARHGVRRDGLYRIVRHPLYLAFIFSQYGYVLNHTTFYNLFVLAMATFFQVLRINEEERLLGNDKTFQTYAQQTPWRIIPRVF